MKAVFLPLQYFQWVVMALTSQYYRVTKSLVERSFYRMLKNIGFYKQKILSSKVTIIWIAWHSLFEEV